MSSSIRLSSIGPTPYYGPDALSLLFIRGLVYLTLIVIQRPQHCRTAFLDEHAQDKAPEQVVAVTVAVVDHLQSSSSGSLTTR